MYLLIISDSLTHSPLVGETEYLLSVYYLFQEIQLYNNLSRILSKLELQSTFGR
jgi:hypothetical protein